MQRCFSLLAYFLIYTAGIAQQYPFVQYTPKDGLVNSRVRKAYQDTRGRMYFLTYGGLSVYDGVRFRNYTTQNGLASDLVNDILEIGDDSMLVATNTGFLNTLINGKVSLFKTENNFCPLVNQFYRRSKNEIYISSDGGLFMLQNNSIRKLNVLSPGNDTVSFLYLGTITGTGNYLIITTNELKGNKGLYLYDIKNNRICDALPDKLVQYLGKDRNERIWISLTDQLYMLDTIALAAGKLLLTTPISGYREAKDYSTHNMTFDENCTWMIYKNKEMIRMEESGSVLRMPLPQQITSSGVQNIFIDREKTMWLCNDGSGIYKIINTLLQVSDNPFGKSTLSYAYRVFCSGDITWFSTGTSKLFRKSQDGLVEYSCNMKQSPVIFHEKDQKLLANDTKNIYEAELDSVKKFIYFRKIINLPDSDYFGKWILVDPYGNIIASLQSGLGVWKNNKLVFHHPIYMSDLIEGLSFDKNYLLWVVKRYKETEVFSLQPENVSTYLRPVFRFATNIINGSPRCFVIDKKGLIWIGTRENGLFVYAREGDHLENLRHFDTGNGLTDNFVITLACDSLNNIIVGTQTGLDRIVRNPENSYRIENLSKSCNFFAYIHDVWADTHQQAFALTNTGALLQLFPVLQDKTNGTPQLLIEEIRANAQPVAEGKNIFSYKENNINFFVAAPSFIDEKQVGFSYLLEGSGNNHWSDTTSGNAMINLTNLSAGKYSLKVKAFFPSTSYNPAEISYSFEITPPWWQTWWFRVIVGLLITGLLIVAVRFYYRRKLEKQKTILERQQAVEKERTRIATDMHDDLGAGLSRIKFLSETIGIKKQQQMPIEEDISKIREYSHEMIDKMGEIVWALNEKNDTLSDLLSYTRAYAVEYLSQNGIECNIESPEILPSDFVAGEFRRNIFLMVKEALHNIVKHAEASGVCIKISVDRALNIEIKDNGIGFDKKNTRPFSNGITNMEKRIKELNGRFEISNSGGTTIKVNVPLKT